MTWCERVQSVEARHNRDTDPDWTTSEQLKADLQTYRTSGEGLTPDLFNRVLTWKLRGQRARTEHHRSNIDAQLLKDITSCALRLQHPDRECLARARLKVIASLPGVGYGVASSVMALVFPHLYAIIDFRVWKVIFNRERTSFSDAQYIHMMRQIWACAERLNWEPQKVDYFAWIAYE